MSFSTTIFDELSVRGLDSWLDESREDTDRLWLLIDNLSCLRIFLTGTNTHTDAELFDALIARLDESREDVARMNEEPCSEFSLILDLARPHENSHHGFDRDYLLPACKAMIGVIPRRKYEM